MIFPTWHTNKMVTWSYNSIAKNVHLSDIDWRYYIISWHKVRKYFYVLQHEQDKFMFYIKQYRLLIWSLVHFKREYICCNESTPF